MARILLLAGLGAAALAALQLVKRSSDEQQARGAWRRLASAANSARTSFDPALVAGLPEPAQRFLRFAIAPGAGLGSVVKITMDGELALGTKKQPRYQPMRAQQLLAPPHGLVWCVRSGKGALRITGSDAMVADRSWTRFWLLGAIPVVRAGGNLDHLRSSFGRVVAEAAFWAPASLLPQAGVEWAALDADTARATVRHSGLHQQVDIRVNADGQPAWVRLARWSNANRQRVFREQPFGGELSDFRSVQGFRVPFRVDGGNFFGTPDYFPFYRARVLTWRVL